MTKLDPAVEISKLTAKHRIVYRRKDAPESVESGLYLDDYGYLSTMAGATVRFTSGRASDLWLGEAPHFVLEAVIPPAFTPHKGMQLVTDAGHLFTYWPDVNAREPWSGTDGYWYTEAEIQNRLLEGVLAVFTSEVPA